MTKEELESSPEYMTVGRLLDWVEKYNISRDAKILLQCPTSNVTNPYVKDSFEFEGEKDIYEPAFGAVKYADGDNNLFLTPNY